MNPDWDDVSVNRRRPLPQGDVRGRFRVGAQVMARTREALVTFAESGKSDGGHEGLVFWAGEESNDATEYSAVVVPDATHSQFGVFVDELAYGRAVREARSQGLVLLAQVHSHPGRDVRHSDGDDDLIVMPFEGMLSLVVPRYGVGWSRLDTAGVHQFQDGRWVQCSADSILRSISAVTDGTAP